MGKFGIYVQYPDMKKPKRIAIASSKKDAQSYARELSREPSILIHRGKVSIKTIAKRKRKR